MEIRRSTNKTEIAYLRINLSDHPVNGANYFLKRSYLTVLYKFIMDNSTNSVLFEQYFNIYAYAFSIIPEDVNNLRNNYKDSKVFYESIHKVTKISFFTKSLYRSKKNVNCKYSLFVDAVYFILYTNAGKFNRDKLLEIGSCLKLRKKTSIYLLDYCTYIHSKKFGNAKRMLTPLSKKNVKKQVIFLLTRVENSYAFDSIPRFVVVVVATMSAGKSTFLNSIVGVNLFPTKNEACTFKPISITDNDYLNHSIAKCIHLDERVELCGVVDENILKEWNKNSTVSAIEVESNIIGIKNNKFSIVLYDTPGTNYSQNEAHKETTYNLLDSKKFHLILFLINASQIATNDEKVLLTKVKQVINNNPETSILFILNKADFFDIEGTDSFEETTNSLYSNLQENGFTTPNIIPVSTYAAKLFKLVLNNVSLTRKELQDFQKFLKLFGNEAYNLPLYAKLKFDLPKPSKMRIKKYKIDGESFSSRQIHNALWATGVPLIEQYLDHLV